MRVIATLLEKPGQVEFLTREDIATGETRATLRNANGAGFDSRVWLFLLVVVLGIAAGCGDSRPPGVRPSKYFPGRLPWEPRRVLPDGSLGYIDAVPQRSPIVAENPKGTSNQAGVGPARSQDDAFPALPGFPTRKPIAAQRPVLLDGRPIDREEIRQIISFERFRIAQSQKTIRMLEARLDDKEHK
jgi:hypothetical protein